MVNFIDINQHKNFDSAKILIVSHSYYPKVKTVQKDLNSHFSTLEGLQAITGEIMCEKPNGAIHKFEGNINIRQCE